MPKKFYNIGPRSVMTPLSDCYLLNIKTVLNFDTMAEIKEQVDD